MTPLEYDKYGEEKETPANISFLGGSPSLIIIHLTLCAGSSIAIANNIEYHSMRITTGRWLYETINNIQTFSGSRPTQPRGWMTLICHGCMHTYIAQQSVMCAGVIIS